MAKISCPQCQQLINSEAIACPHCYTSLKAYGHPGITLHRATEGYLCDTCTYHADNSCNFPQYPQAKSCTLYENLQNRQLELEQQMNINNISFDVKLKRWLQRYQALLWLFLLLFICFLITIFR